MNSAVSFKALGLVSTVLGLLVPVTHTPAKVQNPIGEGIACANGTCCQEEFSICGLDGEEHQDYYFKSEGSCS